MEKSTGKRKPRLGKGRITVAMLATLAAMMGAQALSPAPAAAMKPQCMAALQKALYYEDIGDMDLATIWWQAVWTYELNGEC
jgi:hypothetical protein